MNVCEWFAMCSREAIGVAAHPILDWVPICRECADRFDLTVEPFDVAREAE